MAVMWQGAWRNLQRNCKFRCVTLNSKVNKTTLKHFSQTQLKSINGPLPYYMFRFVGNHLLEINTKYLTHFSSSCFSSSFSLFRVLNVLYDLSDDDALGTEICSCVECHLLNCVYLKCFIVILSEHCNTAGWFVEIILKAECRLCSKNIFGSITLHLEELFLTNYEF